MTRKYYKKRKRLMQDFLRFKMAMRLGMDAKTLVMTSNISFKRQSAFLVHIFPFAWPNRRICGAKTCVNCRSLWSCQMDLVDSIKDVQRNFPMVFGMTKPEIYAIMKQAWKHEILKK